MPPRNQNSCLACAQRKVKCDKLSPCSSCSKSKAACIYRTPAPSQRHRKQLTQGDLLSKIQELEALLHSNSISFNPLGNSWIQSPWQKQLVASPQIQTGSGSSAEAMTAAEAHSAAQVEVSTRDILPDERYRSWRLWSELPEEVRSSLLSFGSMLKILEVENTTTLAIQTAGQGCRRPAHGY
jgi:hypothetical protein